MLSGKSNNLAEEQGVDQERSRKFGQYFFQELGNQWRGNPTDIDKEDRSPPRRPRQ